jgi:hypothetical protein
MKTFLSIALTFITLTAPWRVMFFTARVLVQTPARAVQDTGVDRYDDALDLASRIEDLGYEVTFVNGLEFDGTPAYGLTDKAHDKVYIEANLNWNGRYEVLAHEAGHILQPVTTRMGGECFAETVAFLVTRSHVETHARYLSRDKMGCALTSFAYWPEMYAAARLLESR